MLDVGYVHLESFSPGNVRAIVYSRYGPPDVVRLSDVPTPVPKANEVLIRIRATTVTTADWRARSLEMPPGFWLMGRAVFGFSGPRKQILGTELAGDIAAVGSAVTRFKPGDQVFAFTGASYGCHAEYRVMPETGPIALKPANLSYEQAAALSFGGTTALSFLRDKGKVKRGDKVLIVGASGGVGTAAVQIARHFGAEVTAVCSGPNAELVRSIGANKVIDYTKEDFTKSGATYDIIFDTTGSMSMARCEQSLVQGGRLLLVLASLAQTLGLERASKASGKRVIAGVASERVEDLRLLASLAEAGEFTPVIDQVFPLENAAEAHARVDSGRKRGNVVLTV
jgi:NADPH:quinone reductase-like Zn-dependent oxidoreductase